MKWRAARPIDDLSLIYDIEEQQGILFPDEYKDLVKQYNMAAPDPETFLDSCGKEHIFGRLLSVQSSAKNNVQTAMTWLDNVPPGQVCVPFAIDPFGNLLCFTFSNQTEYVISFFDFETGTWQHLTDNFHTFLSMLF